MSKSTKLEELVIEFKKWRSSKQGRDSPEYFCKAVTELANEYSVSKIAKTLSLD